MYGGYNTAKQDTGNDNKTMTDADRRWTMVQYYEKFSLKRGALVDLREYKRMQRQVLKTTYLNMIALAEPISEAALDFWSVDVACNHGVDAARVFKLMNEHLAFGQPIPVHGPDTPALRVEHSDGDMSVRMRLIVVVVCGLAV